LDPACWATRLRSHQDYWTRHVGPRSET
jgi:hypothetical protein